MQVAMMGDTFHAAEVVLCCIGQHGDNSELFFRTLHHLGRPLDWLTSGRNLLEDDYTTWEPRTVKEILCFWTCFASVYSRDRPALLPAASRLIHRPYFRRAWIEQEVALARTILICCGMDRCSVSRWKSMLCFIACEHSHYKMGQSYFRTSLSHRIAFALNRIHPFPKRDKTNWLTGINKNFLGHAVTQQRHHRSMARLVQSMQSKECSDSHDRIYAALSLIAWNGRESIVPDYTAMIFDLAVEVLEHVVEDQCPHQMLTISTVRGLHFGLRVKLPELQCSTRDRSYRSSLKSFHEARGFPLTQERRRNSILWYRDTFNPPGTTMDNSVEQFNESNQPAGTDPIDRLLFHRYMCDEDLLVGSPSESANSDGQEEVDEWAVNVDNSGNYRFFLILRRTVDGNFSTVGYMVFVGGLEKWKDVQNFILYSSPEDRLRYSVISNHADSLNYPEQAHSIAHDIDRIQILGDQTANFAIQASEDEAMRNGLLDAMIEMDEQIERHRSNEPSSDHSGKVHPRLQHCDESCRTSPPPLGAAKPPPTNLMNMAKGFSMDPRFSGGPFLPTSASLAHA
jgi:hypothetical protein